MKKKILLSSIAAMLCFSMVMPLSTSLYAAEYEGNEEEWLQRCSVPQESAEAAQECAKFKTYYASLNDSLQEEAAALEAQLAEMKDSIESITDAINSQNELIKKMDKQIELNDASIRTIQEEMDRLDVLMTQKERNIDERNKLIVDRMISEQVDIGTNMNIEIIMGASDLIDFIRKMEGLQKITESDQSEIEKLQNDMAKLELQKAEQDRLRKNEEDQKKESEKNKEEAEKIKEKKEKLMQDYLKQEADMNQKMRSVKTDISTLKDNIINIKDSAADELDFSKNGEFTRPVNGPTSAGTWHYPESFGGGVHLGWDIAVAIGTKIVAPCDGIILYANNPVTSTNGFLGNTLGWPQGGGNTIHMLTQVGETTYAISFLHMARENFLVSAGQQVKKGEKIGETGSSGNVTGPHCHIEVINLGSMSLKAAISSFQTSADFAWGTGWGSSALSRICSVSGPPCRERPEKILQ